ncbi:MAG: hypothetical protein IPM16_11915 [Chloroflexi bacterium]|nr:hypothetical protein [Chloroflexota bacterium]
MFRALTLIVCIALLAATGAAAQDSPYLTGTLTTVDVGGVERQYVLFAPDDLPADAPLVVVLHGRFQSARSIEAFTHLNAAAQENGWIVAYPNAVNGSWEDGGRESGLPRTGDPVDDVGFFDAVVADVTATHSTGSINAAAFDTGGTLLQRILCEAETELDTAMLVASVVWSHTLERCAEARIDTRMLLVFGALDSIYEPLGTTFDTLPRPDGTPNRRGGFDETAKFWASRAGCDPDSTQTGQSVVFEGCPIDGQVTAMLLPSAGHEWPRSGDYAITGGFNPLHDGVTLLGELLAGRLPVDPVDPPDVLVPPRTFIAYVPTAYTADAPLPVVVALHGRPDTGAGFAAITAMTPIAEEEGFIAVFPDGVDNQWNYLEGVTGETPYNYVSDVRFLDRLIDDLAVDLNIDAARVYLTGFSNGGFMTYRMACEPTVNRFAAFAVAGALMYPEFQPPCLVSPPRPMLIEHGTEDISISWDGITHMPAPRPPRRDA